MSLRYDMVEGDEMQRRGNGKPSLFCFGRIRSWNRDVVERYLQFAYWPGRRIFIAHSTSGLYSMSPAVKLGRAFGQTSLHVNLQFHLRWTTVRIA